jgi:type IV secretion system protein VirB6
MSVPAFTPAAPITYMINTVTDLASTALNSVATNLITTISPLVAAAFGIYVIFITLNYMRGAEQEPLPDLMVRIISWSLIIGLGLNAAGYTSTVLPIVTGLGGDLANSVSGGTVSANSLDTLAIAYLNVIDTGMQAAQDTTGFSYLGVVIFTLFKALVIILTLAPFLIAAAVALIIANVGALMVAAVAPIFFAFLLFPATRQYFSSWLNTMLAYALIPLFVAVIAVIGVGISTALIAPTGGGTLVTVSFSQVVFAGMGNLILLVALRHVSSLASSLSAGGINMGNAGGVGALASAIRASGRGTSQDLRSLGKAKDGTAGSYQYLKSKLSKNSMRRGA